MTPPSESNTREVLFTPAIEFREDLIGVGADEDCPNIGSPVGVGMWEDEEGGWVIDVYGPEDDRTRRFLLHNAVDLPASLAEGQEVRR